MPDPYPKRNQDHKTLEHRLRISVHRRLDSSSRVWGAYTSFIVGTLRNNLGIEFQSRVKTANPNILNQAG